MNHGMNMQQDMHPFMTAMMMQQTGMPTLGRRSMGFGASPFGGGGPVPVHQMNWLRHGMGNHGMHQTPFGAGQYPQSQSPFPLGQHAFHNPMMGGGFSAPGGGRMHQGAMDCNSMLGLGMWPEMMMMNAGGGGLGGMGLGGMGMNPLMLGGGMNGFGGLGLGMDDDDDDGVWDADPDEDDPLAVFARAMRKGKRRRGNLGCATGAGMNPMFGMMPGMSGMGALGGMSGLGGMGGLGGMRNMGMGIPVG